MKMYLHHNSTFVPVHRSDDPAELCAQDRALQPGACLLRREDGPGRRGSRDGVGGLGRAGDRQVAAVVQQCVTNLVIASRKY